MDEPVVLRTAKVGGFVKDDVLQYVDELNSKNVALEEQIKALQEAGPADPQEIAKYRSQIDNLQDKLNNANNSLRAAKAELETLKKQHESDTALINQLKSQSGGQAGAAVNTPANAAQAAELNSAKAALIKAKEEIDKLKASVEAAENRAKAAEEKANNAAAAPAPAPAPAAVDTSAKDAEIAEAKKALEAKASDLTAKDNELQNKIKELDDKAKLIADKDGEIEKLKAEIQELKENADSAAIPTSFDMGALFTEAQQTAKKITIEAKNAADKAVKEAQAQAKQIVDDANAEAEKAINSANTTADKCVKDANEQAKLTILDANTRADKVNEMADTVRNMLVTEIDGIQAKFDDISGLMRKLTSQASDRMDESKSIIDNARKSITDVPEVKKAELPQDTVFNNHAAMPEYAKVPEKKPVSDMGNSLNSQQNKPVNEQPASNNASKPYQDKNMKKAADFNFDMSELLKAAEEEASKEEALNIEE